MSEVPATVTEPPLIPATSMKSLDCSPATVGTCVTSDSSRSIAAGPPKPIVPMPAASGAPSSNVAPAPITMPPVFALADVSATAPLPIV
ncbi:MAG: hypothetical protein J0H99_21875, partial [Rhodospirillales bacterium]|nr:hypothetical protein [Rhodospirillales bacterium]